MALAADAKPADTDAFHQRIKPFLVKHCDECHGAKKAEGDLRLDTLSADFGDQKTADVWARVRERMRDGEMPPPKRPRPDDAEAQAVLTWVAEQTRSGVRPPVMRRLNRIEYENTLRDLFDLPGLEVKELLPPDGDAEGFDTVAEALDISYVQMARYLETADVALDLAIALGLQPTKPEPTKQLLWPQDSGDWDVRVHDGAVLPLGPNGPDPIWNPETGFIDKSIRLPKYTRRIRALASFFHADSAGQLRFNSLRIPVPGMYRVRISTFTFDWNKGEYLPAQASQPFSLTTATRTFGYYDAPPNEAAATTITTWLEPGEVFHFNPIGLRHGAGLQQKGSAQWKGPGVAVEWIEVEGPIAGPWPLVARQRLFGNLPLQEWQAESKTTRPMRKRNSPILYSPVTAKPMEDAKRLLHDFLSRACRRPMPTTEVERYLPLVRAKLDDGATFEEAMRYAYQAILCSPDFLLLRIEATKNGLPDGFALASRLSYFLWKSMPDEELTRLAANGSLNKPDVLRAQTERLLNDPKSQRFVDDFTNQWLKLRDINATQPDRTLYPEQALEGDVAAYLIDSMVNETRQFFTTMLREDLSVANIVDSEFAMLNEPLAKLYAIDGVQGAELRKVRLAPDSHRGGILTQAGVLKVTANGTTTSPVTRGAWVTTRILGRPLPPPPPDIAAIDPDVRGATTVREQLAKHRDVESCAACHAKMDPPGFALESYDVVGAWRENYRVLKDNRLERKGPAVDPTGETADGRAFKDLTEYKRILLADQDQLARSLASKLLVYAIGRTLSGADRLEVDDLVNRLRDKNQGVRSLLHEVIQTRAFRASQ
ncbi:MAG: DUF1592 domain-containing protein [Planctomycetia bacterium]|nr:DUF1592 domain-containing protein [Planctomycetia bacterium]